MSVRTLRPLKNAPFRSLRLSAQFLYCVQILILEIFNIFLWLKPSRALTSNEIEHFSKASPYEYIYVQSVGKFVHHFYSPAGRGCKPFLSYSTGHTPET